MLEPVIEALGFELVGIEYQANPKNAVLRIYIDTEQGVTLDHCAQVSHQVSGVLDVEDPIQGNYNLEVSSPGVDRPLFKFSDFERFAGELVRIRISGAIEGRRKFHGVLRGVRDDTVLVECDGAEWALPFGQVDKAHLDREVEI